jgi:hypothetical protein
LAHEGDCINECIFQVCHHSETSFLFWIIHFVISKSVFGVANNDP